MGSSASKPARSAAQAATRRQYPKQPSTPSPAAPTAPRLRPTRTAQPPPPQAPPPAAPKYNVQQSSQGQGPVYHSKEQASTEKSAAIDLDGRDPHFAASLRSIGPVTPSPTLSNSSTFTQSQSQSHLQPHSAHGTNPTIFPTPSNPALLAITARQRIAREAEAEAESMGQGTFTGRRYLDALTIRQALDMRDKQGLPGKEIERALRLKAGTVESLGAKGVMGVP
ncbi:hypothetical protein BJY01DRAFT_252383 [Aspergillus pseudoustus]|uniref:Helix-turn-helix domain-containing protein n=1 Tax=Aspergillus pseudoustus TaxID=1810923 RepID=A0ABR4J6S6_9EURO